MPSAYGRAVLFDAAGTLIHLNEPVGETYSRVACGYGVEQSADSLDLAFRHAFVASPPMVFPHADPGDIPTLERAWWYRCVDEAFARCSGSPTRETFSTQSRFDQFFEELFTAMGAASAWHVVDGGLDLLDALRRRGYGIAIVSNFDFRLPALLDALGIAERVDVVILPADVGAAKPDPAPFERAIAELGVSRNNTLVVGDHLEQDIEAARNVGIRAVDVGSLATISELIGVLDAINQG